MKRILQAAALIALFAVQAIAATNTYHPSAQTHKAGGVHFGTHEHGWKTQPQTEKSYWHHTKQYQQYQVGRAYYNTQPMHGWKTN